MNEKIQWVGEWLIKLHSEFMCGNISRPFTPNYFTLSNEDYRRDLSVSFVMLHTHLRYTRWLLEFTWFYESCVNLLNFQTEIPYPDQVHSWRVLKKYTKELGSVGFFPESQFLEKVSGIWFPGIQKSLWNFFRNFKMFFQNFKFSEIWVFGIFFPEFKFVECTKSYWYVRYVNGYYHCKYNA